MEVFPFLPFVPDRKSVLRRLGSQKAQFSQSLETEIDGYMRQAQSAFSARGKAAVSPLRHIDASCIAIDGLEIASPQLARLLGSSCAVYLMGASIPDRDVEKIALAMRDGDGLKAIVFDAYASEYVDGTLDVIMSRKNESLRRTGQKLTRHRFSPGYGDLDLKYQKTIFELLDLSTLDVTINENYLLSPEKSVIAIAGVE
jgi:hypothetical protein